MLPDFDQHLPPLPLRFFFISFLAEFILFSLHFFYLIGIDDTGDPCMPTRIIIPGVARPYDSLCTVEFLL
jgi:hypothetical protein